MIKRIIPFLLLSLSMLAQAPDTTNLPERWKKESIVVLNHTHSIRISTSGSHYEETKVVYYLRDKWGLDEVSQVSLPANVLTSRRSSIGTVYKRNGTIINIDTTHLIPSRSKIDIKSSLKRNPIFSIESENGQKLAVPSLEVGDILEISYERKISQPPTIIPLVHKFCVMNYSLSLSVDNSSGYGYGGYGGFLSVVVDPLLMNTKATFRSQGENNFSIQMENTDKYKEEILNDDLSQIPYVLVKFKYRNYAAAAKTDKEFVKMTNEEMKTDQMSRVLSIYPRNDKEERNMAKRISSTLSKKYPKLDDTLAYVKDAYYLYREIVGGDYLYAGYNRTGYKSNIFFVNVMGRVLEKKKIRSKVFLSQENHYGGTARESDFLEPVYGIVVPSLDFYLFNPLYNLEPGNIPSHFENQTYVSFTANQYYKKNRYKWWLLPIGLYAPMIVSKSGTAIVAGLGAALTGSIVDIAVRNAKSKKKRKYDYASGHFPLSQPSYNQVSTDLEIRNLKTSGKPLEIETKNSFYGKMKISELSKLNNYSDIYHIEKNVYKELINEKITPATKDEKELEEKTMKKVFTFDLKDDGFEVDKVTSYSFDQANFFNTGAPLKYSLNYTSKNMLVESGDYLILNAGHLIGEQLIVNEKSSERTQDFYIPYQKQFTKQISIHIPEGYTVQNIEDFSVSKETTAGKFVSKAYVDGNKVVINTTKTYGFQYYDKEDVDDIYSFLRVAEQFRNKRLVLKK